jgi:hypothetical protein
MSFLSADRDLARNSCYAATVVERPQPFASLQGEVECDVAVDLIHARRSRFAIECEWQPGFLSVATSPKKKRPGNIFGVDFASAMGTLVARPPLTASPLRARPQAVAATAS